MYMYTSDEIAIDYKKKLIAVFNEGRKKRSSQKYNTGTGRILGRIFARSLICDMKRNQAIFRMRHVAQPSGDVRNRKATSGACARVIVCAISPADEPK